MIQINRPQGAAQAVFDPSPKLVNFNDTITWRNNDPNQAHWPAPAPAPNNPVDKTGWIPAEILPHGTNFQAVTFGTNKNPPVTETYEYVCANHPTEKGTITVTTNAVPPEPVADAGSTT